MAAPDPEHERLLKAERLAFERYDGLRGYPGDVQEVALALWTEATEAVCSTRTFEPAGFCLPALRYLRIVMAGFLGYLYRPYLNDFAQAIVTAVDSIRG
jgi:hypothetical protein